MEALQASHVMAIGGDPLGERHLWWNFLVEFCHKFNNESVQLALQRKNMEVM